MFKYFTTICLAIGLAFGQSGPTCSNTANDISNKCGDIACTSDIECQSQLCSVESMLCQPCLYDGIKNTTLRCEGLYCETGSECLFGTCYKNKFDKTQQFNIEICVMIVIPTVLILGSAISCCLRLRRKRLDR